MENVENVTKLISRMRDLTGGQSLHTAPFLIFGLSFKILDSYRFLKG